MASIISLLVLNAGGTGSGCHGPNCGRPVSQAAKKWATKQKAKATRDRNKLMKQQARDRAARKASAPGRKALQKRLGYKKTKKWLKENAAKIKQGAPVKIVVKDPSKRWVKQQGKTPDGAKWAILKPAGQNDKSGMSWAGKISPYKGQFSQTLSMPTVYNAQEHNTVFERRDDQGQQTHAVIVHRNFGEGDKHVTVKEVDLGDHAAISRWRQVSFNNIGRAAGFLNRRYGIRFKLT